MDSSGKILKVNGSACAMLGYSREEMLDLSVSDIEALDTPDDIAARTDRILKTGGERFVSRHRRKDGTEIDLEVSISLLQSEGVFSVFVRDITERKQVEQALRDSETRFRMAIEASSEGLWDWDVLTGCAHFSPGYFRMLGYEPGEFTPSAQSWVDLIHPDDRQCALDVAQECIENRIQHIDVKFRMRTKSGSWKWILGRGQAYQRGADGRALCLIGTNVDINELKRVEEELKQTNRMVIASNTELEQFAYVASHDLREPLRMISSYLSLLERRYGDRLDVPIR